MAEAPFFSFVIPVYNEAESLQHHFKLFHHYLAGSGRKYEIIFIDDGSTDNSFEIIRILQKKDKCVKLIKFGRNMGKSEALNVGFEEAKGKYIVTIDGDFQEDPEDTERLLEKLGQGYDIVSGWRRRRNDSVSKVIPSIIFNKFISLITGLKLHDINCGFKIYKRDVIESILIYGEQHRVIPLLAYYKGYKVGEAEVIHKKREFGRSKYKGLIRWFHGILDLFSVIFLATYSKRPFHLFGSLGSLLFCSGFAVALYLSLRYFFAIQFIGERMPLLIFSVLLMVIGIQFISFGLLGELIVRGFITKGFNKLKENRNFSIY